MAVSETVGLRAINLDLAKFDVVYTVFFFVGYLAGPFHLYDALGLGQTARLVPI